jgi:dihydrofolate synthase / folylpolyglutamate synthase
MNRSRKSVGATRSKRGVERAPGSRMSAWRRAGRAMAPGVPSLAEVLPALYARVPMGVRLGLGPLAEACRALGHPERAFEVAHVAGTNGKGSVSAMVASIARAQGLRAGLYTSPHLSRFAERIQIAGSPIEDSLLASLLADTLARAPELTFFEVATLSAFRAFREAKVDLAVLEVGLGGRLDATNVVPTPRAAAITRIAFDHTDRLGTTLDAIAREKAGIAKPGLEIVLGPLPLVARTAIEETARAAGAATRSADEDPEASMFVEKAIVGLVGAHQRDNAKIAYLMGGRLGATKEERAIGLERVRWPGRLETIATPRGDVLLDAAHNPDGIDSLTRHLATVGLPPAGLALVFGALTDKAWPEMIDRLAPLTPHRFYVRPSGRAAVDVADLAARHAGEPMFTLADALSGARAVVGERGLVVVCGSILLVGEARSALLALPRDPPVAM